MTHGDDPSPPPGSAVRRRELGLAAIVLALAVAATLWRPIVHFRTRTLGSWDWLAQSSTLTRLERPRAAVNGQLTDPVRQMLPWSVYVAQELRAGRAPLWNPLNGCGVPLLANYQSGVLSPFNAPFYVLPLGAAALLSHALKLAVAGFLAFAFLRSLERSFAASLFGACAYALAGFHLVCIQHPHVGVMALLPGALYFAERALQAIERDGALSRSTFRALAGVAAFVALSALAGHPETLAANMALLAAYCAWRSIEGVAARRCTVTRAASGGAVLVVAGAIGAGLAAVQILPFLEYFAHAYVMGYTDRSGPALKLEELPLQVFPALFGAPMDGNWSTGELPWPTFQDASSFHVGALALCLALCAPFLPSVRRRALPWCVLLAVEFALVYDFGGLTESVRAVLLLRVMPAMRTHSFWLLSIAVLAAYSIDGWSGWSRAQRSRATAFAVVALASMLGAAFGARGLLIANTAREVVDSDHVWAVATAHMRYVGIAFAVGSAGALTLFAGKRRLTRGLGAAALVTAQVATTGLVLGHYAPAVEDAFVLPRTDRIEALCSAVGDERVVFLSSDHLSANSNLAYGLRTVTSYDAVDIHRYRELTDRMFGVQGYVGATLRATPQALALFGVRYVTARSDWLPIGTQFALEAGELGECDPYLRLEIQRASVPQRSRVALGAEPLRQELRADVDGLDGLALRWIVPPDARDAWVELELFDLEADCPVLVTRLSPSEARQVPGGALETVLRFEPIDGSLGRRYALTLRRLDRGRVPIELVRMGAASRAQGAGDDEPSPYAPARFDGWRLTSGSKPQQGRIVLDLSGRTPFTPLQRIGEHTLFRFDAGRGRAWIASEVIVAPDEDESLARVLRADFDPYRAVVIEERDASGSLAGGGDAGGSVTWLSESPQRLELRARAAHPGYLVLSQPHYPGWTARVDGEGVPLLRANYAFTALALPAGEHTVEISYEPRSVSLGLLIGGVSALVWLGVVMHSRRDRGRGQRVRAGPS